MRVLLRQRQALVRCKVCQACIPSLTRGRPVLPTPFSAASAAACEESSGALSLPRSASNGRRRNDAAPAHQFGHLVNRLAGVAFDDRHLIDRQDREIDFQTGLGTVWVVEIGGLKRNCFACAYFDAWRVVINKSLEIASKPLAAGNAPSEVIKRDREIGALDHFLSSSGWDLWRSIGNTVERTSDHLARWWTEPYSAKAVLILDGLSLRELPWLLQGAKEHGFTLHEVSANASELPGETNEFARALGFGSRSQLQNKGGGFAHKLQPHIPSVSICLGKTARR